jgi:hypothetical protein
VTPREAAVATVERVLRDHPDVASRRLGATQWALALPGSVRLAIPVAIDVGTRTTTVSSFLLRGPRSDRSGDPATLHRVLLRKNARLHRLQIALDEDDDVILIGRIPTANLSPAEVEETLAEVLSVGDEAFEGLVHLGYPGVFPPLRRQFNP